MYSTLFLLMNPQRQQASFDVSLDRSRLEYHHGPLYSVANLIVNLSMLKYAPLLPQEAPERPLPKTMIPFVSNGNV